jgi:hypothetical protein
VYRVRQAQYPAVLMRQWSALTVWTFWAAYTVLKQKRAVYTALFCVGATGLQAVVHVVFDR